MYVGICIIMVLFELPYSQVKEVEVEFYGLRFEDSKIFFRKKYGTYPRSAYIFSIYTRGYKYMYMLNLGVQCMFKFNCIYSMQHVDMTYLNCKYLHTYIIWYGFRHFFSRPMCYVIVACRYVSRYLLHYIPTFISVLLHFIKKRVCMQYLESCKGLLRSQTIIF